MTMTPMTTSSGQRALRSYPERAFELGQVLAAKATSGATVSACIPARNEDATVGLVVTAIRSALIDGAIAAHGTALVDEIVVVDDHSTDRDRRRGRGRWGPGGRRRLGARPPRRGPRQGRGAVEVASTSPPATSSCGSTPTSSTSTPTSSSAWSDRSLCDPTLDFVKGHYHRPEANGVGGGRVTELLARPLLSLYFPELAEIAQPLAGEYAGRRTLLERLPFVVGYGVDVALLIDAMRLVGIERIAQVDLGVRHHRNRTLDELGPQALAVGQAILDRAGSPARRTPRSCTAPDATRSPSPCTNARRSTRSDPGRTGNSSPRRSVVTTTDRSRSPDGASSVERPVIAESDATVIVEGNHYFPPESVDRSLLEAVDTTTVCPWKGTASYYDIVVDGEAQRGRRVVLPGAQGRRGRDHAITSRSGEASRSADLQRPVRRLLGAVRVARIGQTGPRTCRPAGRWVGRSPWRRDLPPDGVRTRSWRSPRRRCWPWPPGAPAATTSTTRRPRRVAPPSPRSTRRQPGQRPRPR